MRNNKETHWILFVYSADVVGSSFLAPDFKCDNLPFLALLWNMNIVHCNFFSVRTR